MTAPMNLPGTARSCQDGADGVGTARPRQGNGLPVSKAVTSVEKSIRDKTKERDHHPTHQEVQARARKKLRCLNQVGERTRARREP